MDAIRCAALSLPSGKMILAVSVLICFHLTEGGLPPNSWALEKEKLNIKNVKHKSLGIRADLKKEVTEKDIEASIIVGCLTTLLSATIANSYSLKDQTINQRVGNMKIVEAVSSAVVSGKKNMNIKKAPDRIGDF